MSKPSQKEKFIREIERRIISGELVCGDRLPTERELVEELNMSRTVVHSGLGELAALGFIKTKPRKGYLVTDYRTEGTLSVLESIMHYNGGNLAPDLLNGLMQSRRLIELETASLAAEKRTGNDLKVLEDILRAERESTAREERFELDFSFHHTVAVASKNPLYPLILKSFEPLQKQLIESFYSIIADPLSVTVRHERLFDAIKESDARMSSEIMAEILEHGEKILKEAVES